MQLAFFKSVFDTSGFVSRWSCGNWSAAHGWTHIVSDLAIFGAYAAIPISIGYFVLKRRDVPLNYLFWLFAVFIFSCGFGHLVEATLFWHPWYRFSAVSKVTTAVASWVTVLALIRKLPAALALPGVARLNAELLRENEERKRVEAALQESLREKELLLREIHHRVKNNLQVVASLLNLQASHTKDGAAQRLFEESRNRIGTMALVHEKLYRTQGLGKVDFADYVNTLAADLFDSYNVAADRCHLQLELDQAELGIETASTCGLIINELLSNALKHAFPGGRPGTILISLRKLGKQRWRLAVRDDGVGFPQHLDFRKTQSLGMQLVNTLTAQLDGVIALKTANGSEFILEFGEIPHQARVEAPTYER